MNTQINIEDELSALWQRIYTEIVRFVTAQGFENQKIELACCRVKALIVDDEGFLFLINGNDETIFAEDYEDSVLYEVYDSINNQFNAH